MNCVSEFYFHKIMFNRMKQEPKRRHTQFEFALLACNCCNAAVFETIYSQAKQFSLLSVYKQQ